MSSVESGTKYGVTATMRSRALKNEMSRREYTVSSV